MGLFNKKDNKARLIDEFGDMREPVETNKEYEENHYIEEVYGRNERNRKIQSVATKAIIGGIAASLAFCLVTGPVSIVTTVKNREHIDAVASPAFKTRYDDLGAEVIKSYYAQKQPIVNVTTQVHWPGVSISDTGGVTKRDANSAPRKESSEIFSKDDRNAASNNAKQRNVTSAQSSAPVTVENVSFIGGKQVPFRVSEEDKKTIEKGKTFPNPRQENLSYTGVIDSNVYIFTVSLIIPDIDDPLPQPYLAQDPTMTYFAPITSLKMQTGTTPPTNDPTKFAPINLDETTMDTIDDWVSAYVENDSSTLKRLTGDTDAQNAYYGLGGFSLIGRTSVVWSYAVNPTGKEDDDSPVVARISYQMRSTDSSLSQKIGKNNQDVPFAPMQYMDILITGANAGIPSIVAWAPAGEWESLKSYMNATVVDNETQKSVQEKSTSSTTSSSSTSSTSSDTTTEKENESSGKSTDGSKTSSSRSTSSTSGRSSASKKNSSTTASQEKRSETQDNRDNSQGRV